MVGGLIGWWIGWCIFQENCNSPNNSAMQLEGLRCMHALISTICNICNICIKLSSDLDYKELGTAPCSTWDELVIYGSICFNLTGGRVQ